MMNRLLVVAVLAVTLIRPAAAGTVGFTLDEPPAPRSVLDATGERGMTAAGDFWIRAHAVLSRMGARPKSTSATLRSGGARNVAPCDQALALGPDARCTEACGAAREACDRQCSARRATCMTQCPVVGFACDPMRQTAYLICRGNCGRAHESCLSNCHGIGEKN